MLFWQYHWNGNSSLKEVIRLDRKKVAFTYDALGRRIQKTYNKKTTRWVWDGNTPLHEWIEEAEQPKITTWVFDEGRFSPAAKLTGNKSYSIVTDYLGTPVQAYDESGRLKWETELDIYGKVRTFEGDKALIPFRYQGQYEDAETGLYYNRFRYYSPDEGMYLSQDPIGLKGGMQLYGYVYDPNIWIDRFGLAGGYIFRGDDAYKGGNVGLPLGSDADITDPYTHVTRPSKGETSIYTSFSEETKKAAKFGSTSKVSMDDLKILEAEGKIKIHTPESVRDMFGGKEGKNAFNIMKNNSEVLIEGEIPANKIKKCK